MRNASLIQLSLAIRLLQKRCHSETDSASVMYEELKPLHGNCRTILGARPGEPVADSHALRVGDPLVSADGDLIVGRHHKIRATISPATCVYKHPFAIGKGCSDMRMVGVSNDADSRAPCMLVTLG